MASDRLPQGLPHRNDRCDRCGNPFAAGGAIWSFMVAGGPRSRQDFCGACWAESPQSSGVWWRGVHTPASEKELAKKRSDRLLQLALGEESEAEPADGVPSDPVQGMARRYAAALALWRLRRLRLEQVQEKEGREVLVFRIIGSQKRFEAFHPGLSEGELRTMEEALLQESGDATSLPSNKAA